MFTNIFCVIIVSLSFIYPASIILDHALPKLSDYKFFKHPIRDQIPEKNILPYSISSPLFSDYAEKMRFIRVPDGSKILLDNENNFIFPEDKYLIKTFHYYH